MASPIDIITQAIRNALAGGISDAAPTLDAAAKETGAGVDTALQGVFSGGFSLDDLLLLIPGVGELLTLPGGAISAVFSKAGSFIEGIAAGWLLGSLFTEVARPVYLELVHAVQDAVQSDIFDAQTAAALAAAGIISTDFAHSEAAGSNFDASHTDYLIDQAQVRPGLGELLELLRRGAVQDADVDAALKHQTIPEFWWGPLKSLSRTLLSPADLALALLRGNIEQSTADGYAAQLGLHLDDLGVLVGNTGEPPGPQELSEAYRRGFIDQATFEHGIRQSRIRDEWIPTMDKLRLSPMSVADAVRAVVENYLTTEQGQVIAEQNGLEPEHWPIMVEAYGRPLSHEQMMTLYHRGLVTLDQVHQAFRESDLKDKYIDQAVELGRRLVPERTIVSMLDHGVITHDVAMVMLTQQGYDDADAAALVALGGAQHIATRKALTKADLVSLYVDNLITRKDAEDRIVALGYTAADATEELDLAEFKAHASALKTTERGIEASLKAHHLSEQEAVKQLTNAGLTASQSQQLVDEWVQQRGTPTRSLTEAQILKLGEAQILNAADVKNRLIAYGLIAGDADLLLELHGIGAAPPGAVGPMPSGPNVPRPQ